MFVRTGKRFVKRAVEVAGSSDGRVFVDEWPQARRTGCRLRVERTQDAAGRGLIVMLRKLIEAALNMRLAVIGIALGLAAFGAYAFANLPIDAFPDISSTQVKIIMKAPGMTPEEVESRVITPVEMELLGIPNQTVLRSVAKYAIADITINFEDGTDIYWARSQVAERLANATAGLPATVEGGMAPISTPLSDMYMFTVEGPISLTEKRRLLDWTIRPALRTVPGVADVNALGGMVETFEVQPDFAALAAANLTIEDIKAAVEASNRNDGAGRLAVAEEALIVRSVGAIRSLDDLASVVVRSANGNVVRIGDVATVRMGSLTRYGAVTKNGTAEAVQGLVIALRGADASKVVAGIKDRLAEVQATLPKGVTIAPFYDRSDLIGRAVGTVEDALLEAIVLVVILLLLFLGDVRASVIVALALPMAALMTFICMRAIGLTANLMSLGGLAIAVGMLVDGAVVVVENVVERLSDARHKGASKLNCVFVATAEVATPVASGMAIIALVFLPLLTLEGLEGKLFAPVAMTIVLSPLVLESKPFRNSTLKVNLIGEKNLTDNVDNNRITAGVEWSQVVNEKIRFNFGYDFRRFSDNQSDSSVFSNLITVGADYRPTSKLDFSVKREQNLGDEDPSFPNQTLIGANYQFSPNAKLFFTQRLASNPITPISDVSGTGFASSKSRYETALGVETQFGKYTSLSGRYQLESGINGTDSFSIIGLQNTPSGRKNVFT